MGTRNYVNTYKLTDPTRSRGTRICRSFYGSHIAANKNRNVSGTDILFTDQLYIRGLDHGISGLDSPYKSFGLNHSESF
jgi:hypothetical protein